MNCCFRACTEADFSFVLDLKEKCFRWYIEKIYGWDEDTQAAFTQNEMDAHLPDMNIIRLDAEDIGLFTFYHDDSGDACIGMFAILPEHQGKGIGTSILSRILEKEKNTRFYLKTYKENPARYLYQRMGFRKYDETETHWLMERTSGNF